MKAAHMKFPLDMRIANVKSATPNVFVLCVESMKTTDPKRVSMSIPNCDMSSIRKGTPTNFICCRAAFFSFRDVFVFLCSLWRAAQ